MPLLPAVLVDGGSTAAERALHLACDELVPGANQVLHRAVDCSAPVTVVRRWLCQLRVAPYSYDLVDNLGRRSPRTLTPGLSELELGQRACAVFTIGAFDDRSVTIVIGSRLLGRTAMTYVALPGRLYLRLAVRHPRLSPLRLALPPGDLVMATKQLRTLAGLAERTGPTDLLP